MGWFFWRTLFISRRQGTRAGCRYLLNILIAGFIAVMLVFGVWAMFFMAGPVLRPTATLVIAVTATAPATFLNRSAIDLAIVNPTPLNVPVANANSDAGNPVVPPPSAPTTPDLLANLTPFPKTKMYVCVQAANIRTGPSTNYPINQQTTSDYWWYVVGKVGEWYYLGYDENGTNLFMHQSTLCSQPLAAPSVAPSPARVLPKASSTVECNAECQDIIEQIQHPPVCPTMPPHMTGDTRELWLILYGSSCQ